MVVAPGEGAGAADYWLVVGEVQHWAASHKAQDSTQCSELAPNVNGAEAEGPRSGKDKNVFLIL